jgi:polysaccharide export outer membrane protein
MLLKYKITIIIFSCLVASSLCQAQQEGQTAVGQNASGQAQSEDITSQTPADASKTQIPGQAGQQAQERSIGVPDDVHYTIGPNDVLEVKVQRHPEFSGIFPVNSEGRIQYELIGDVEVSGLTKPKAEDKLRKLVTVYVIKPDLNIKIVEYRSKAIYVIGEVTRPGKYYIKSSSIPVREAVVEAGFPTQAAATNKARLITPDKESDGKTKIIDLYAILYDGNLKQNLDMQPGDQLYIPSTQEEAANLKNKAYAGLAAAINEQADPSQPDKIISAEEAKKVSVSEEVIYTLGPDDVIEIAVQRHPEFSGTFPINLEGKIQYEFVGDVEVTGLTKKELEAKIKKLIGGYVVNPEVNVTILEYRSKVFYVLGEVGRPGKFYMRSESIPVREAIMEAGLPTIAAAMRKCRLISPAKEGKSKTKSVDVYSLLYAGDLERNIDMKPGDVLYVPSTVMAKVFRTIAPITEPVTSAAEAQTGITTLNTRPANTRSRTTN